MTDQQDEPFSEIAELKSQLTHALNDAAWWKNNAIERYQESKGIYVHHGAQGKPDLQVDRGSPLQSGTPMPAPCGATFLTLREHLAGQIVAGTVVSNHKQNQAGYPNLSCCDERERLRADLAGTATASDYAKDVVALADALIEELDRE